MESIIMRILENLIGADPGELEPDVMLFEDGILDSFALIGLFVEVEKLLGVRMEPTEFDRDLLATPQKIIDVIKKHL